MWDANPAALVPAFRPCVLIPTYNNAQAVADVVHTVREHLTDVIVVDDGSSEPTRSIVAKLAEDGLIVALRLPKNRGKGAAVKAGFAEVARLGFTHAMQVDGDGQHDASRMPAFLQAAREHPQAAIIASPVYDDTAPAARLAGRKITTFWVAVETGGRIIDDAMIGFRVYPVQASLDANPTAERMGFDIEIVVKLAWAGVPIVNMPVPVRYISAEDGGLSHFRPFADNALISWTHTRLTFWSIIHRLLSPFRRNKFGPSAARRLR